MKNIYIRSMVFLSKAAVSLMIAILLLVGNAHAYVYCPETLPEEAIDLGCPTNSPPPKPGELVFNGAEDDDSSLPPKLCFYRNHAGTVGFCMMTGSAATENNNWKYEGGRLQCSGSAKNCPWK